jgi:hypothetical protein
MSKAIRTPSITVTKAIDPAIQVGHILMPPIRAINIPSIAGNTPSLSSHSPVRLQFPTKGWLFSAASKAAAKRLPI